jgi:hypothetical protein
MLVTIEAYHFKVIITSSAVTLPDKRYFIEKNEEIAVDFSIKNGFLAINRGRDGKEP